MILFKSITVQNFLSYGNSPSTIKLDRAKNTIIIGDNGSGKSAIISDGICYALYGKPYRDIKLSQLVNSINLKSMKVSIEFSVGPVSYKVVRGQKPAIFEIYKDDVLIPQEAATKDYQELLELSVLKINYKTFSQVVILGTASFIPFMQLSGPQRRDVIEDVLDIAIFSEMNSVHKIRVAENKEELNSVTTKVEFSKRDIESQTRLIKMMTDNIDSRVTEERDAISDLMDQGRKSSGKISDLKKHKVVLQEALPEMVQPQEKSSLERAIQRGQDETSRLSKRLNQIHELQDCPTCLQSVGDAHKSDMIKTINDSISTEKSEIESLRVKFEILDKKNTAYNLASDEISKLDVAISTIRSEVSRFVDEVKRRENTIKEISSNNSDLDAENIKLNVSIKETALHLKRKYELLEEKEIQNVVTGLLKDTGIKAAIIREYIPILNSIINKYLGIFGFSINFTLDENFNEKILSRGRDDFSYFNFSEGEKRRIDLSLLFAFRQVSEMKNSANCNLLVADEVADSSFDYQAKEAFLGILNDLQGNNFVISHSATDVDSYNDVISVAKKGDFSVMEYIT